MSQKQKQNGSLGKNGAIICALLRKFIGKKCFYAFYRFFNLQANFPCPFLQLAETLKIVAKFCITIFAVARANPIVLIMRFESLICVIAPKMSSTREQIYDLR